MSQRASRLVTPIALAGLLLLSGCTTAYYGVMEQFGQEKRHILADRVEASRSEQGEAQEEFQDAYDQFKSVTGYDGGDVEAVYRDLAAALERSENKAERVSQRIDSVENVAQDLFAEWRGEIEQISNPELRRSSSRSLQATEVRYEALLRAMQRAEARMEPVLVAFRDQVLFLKHNLNARAIASLEGTVLSIEGDVQTLLNDLGQAIQEADRFLRTLEG